MKRMKWLSLVFLVLVLSYALGERSYGQEPVPDPAQQPLKEIALYYPMGAPGHNAKPHPKTNRIHSYVNRYDGYESFFMKRLAAHYKDDGVRRFVLHLANGRDDSKPMRFDEAVAIEEDVVAGRLPKEALTRPGWLCYWAGRFLEKYKDAKIDFYVGSLPKTKSMVKVRDSPGEYFCRYKKSLEFATAIPDLFDVDASRIRIIYDQFSGGANPFDSESGRWEPFVEPRSIEMLAFEQTAKQFRVAIEPHWAAVPEFQHLQKYDAVVLSHHWYSAWLKSSNKPLLGHVTLLINNLSSADRDIERAVKDRNVDCIAAVPVRLADVRAAQKKYIEELEVR